MPPARITLVLVAAVGVIGLAVVTAVTPRDEVLFKREYHGPRGREFVNLFCSGGGNGDAEVRAERAYLDLVQGAAEVSRRSRARLAGGGLDAAISQGGEIYREYQDFLDAIRDRTDCRIELTYD